MEAGVVAAASAFDNDDIFGDEEYEEEEAVCNPREITVVYGAQMKSLTKGGLATLSCSSIGSGPKTNPAKVVYLEVGADLEDLKKVISEEARLQMDKDVYFREFARARNLIVMLGRCLKEMYV